MKRFRKHGLWLVVVVLVTLSLFGLLRILAGSSNTEAGTNGIPIVRWELLDELDFRTGTTTASLSEIDGQIVRVPGFVVPLEDDYQSASEFLLVPDAGSCVHVPPPPPNQMVYVKMKAGQTVSAVGLPIWVTGKIRISNVKSPYGLVSYSMDGDEGVIFVSWDQFEKEKRNR